MRRRWPTAPSRLSLRSARIPVSTNRDSLQGQKREMKFSFRYHPDEASGRRSDLSRVVTVAEVNRYGRRRNAGREDVNSCRREYELRQPVLGRVAVKGANFQHLAGLAINELVALGVGIGRDS